MSLGSALAKIMHASSHEELEQAAAEFTEAQEALKKEIEGVISTIMLEQSGESGSLQAAEQPSMN